MLQAQPGRLFQTCLNRARREILAIFDVFSQMQKCVNGGRKWCGSATRPGIALRVWQSHFLQQVIVPTLSWGALSGAQK